MGEHLEIEKAMSEAIPIPPADDDMNVWLTMLFGFGQPVMTVQSAEDMAAAEAQGEGE
jgi:hypothetical protein